MATDVTMTERAARKIGQILQATPEFQQANLQKQTTQYGEQLNSQNQGILDQAGAQAQSRFAGLGRPQTSALGASIMQAGGQLAQQRQSALADFYGRGLQQNQALQQQGGASGLDRAYGLRDETRQFGQQMALAKYQQDNYNNYLNQANSAKRRQAIGQAIGAIGGGLLGSYLAPVGGGAAGAMAGGQIGSSAGGLF